jgi:hypothetical protein
MYTILYLREVSSGQREHREITCSSIADLNRIRVMLRGDKTVFDLSFWQGATRLN